MASVEIGDIDLHTVCLTPSHSHHLVTSTWYFAWQRGTWGHPPWHHKRWFTSVYLIFYGERESAICIYIYICSLILAVSVGFFCISHALFHTQLSHTPSLTHNFVTHTIFLCHPPSFTHNFVTDTIFLCHTPSFTHHFVAHNSSHRTCFTS